MLLECDDRLVADTSIGEYGPQITSSSELNKLAERLFKKFHKRFEGISELNQV